jgi:hypothetical protein
MSESQGGSGGKCARNTRETRMVARALRERWHIPKAMRGTLIDRLGRILEADESGPREIISAARAILSASKINLDNISVSIKAIEELELEARVTELERMDKEKLSGWPA